MRCYYQMEIRDRELLWRDLQAHLPQKHFLHSKSGKKLKIRTSPLSLYGGEEKIPAFLYKLEASQLQCGSSGCNSSTCGCIWHSSCGPWKIGMWRTDAAKVLCEQMVPDPEISCICWSLSIYPYHLQLYQHIDR